MKPCSHHRPPGDKQLGPESPNVHVFTQPPAILLYFFFSTSAGNVSAVFVSGHFRYFIFPDKTKEKKIGQTEMENFEELLSRERAIEDLPSVSFLFFKFIFFKHAVYI